MQLSAAITILENMWERKTADHKSQISYLRAQVNQLLRFYLATEVKFHVELPVKLATFKAIPASGRDDDFFSNYLFWILQHLKISHSVLNEKKKLKNLPVQIP